MKQDRILIIGASGTVGSHLTSILRGSGNLVSEATSKKEAQGEKVYINLSTGEGLHEALMSVDKAFLLSPPGYADQYAMLSPIIQEAKRAGLKKVVLMTAMGANAVETTPFRRAEIELEKSGLNYNIIRPNWFMQNFNTFWIHGILAANTIALPAGAAKTSFIDARDIAAVAAKLLTTDLYNNRDFDLTGPEALTHGDVAKAIGVSVGREIVYKDIAPEVLHNQLVQAGLPPDYVGFLIMIFGFLREGYNSGLTDTVEMITGEKPRSLSQYTRDYKQNWVVNK